MTHPPLACTVRGCGRPLEPGGRNWSCAAGHTFDVARSGYVNLLQPNDRRSLQAGDSRESVAARARLNGAGIGRALFDDIVRRATAVPLSRGGVVVDLGSGSGDVLAAVSRDRLTAVGIDLSPAAAEHAARRYPGHTWVVANADRRLPLLDRCVDLVLSIQGRRNPAECARVLTTGGALLISIPAPDDLIELREVVQGERVERSRSEAVIAEHADRFTLVERATPRQRQPLGRAALLDLLRATYRGERLSTIGRVQALDTLEVTQASDVLLFARRS